MIDGIAPALSPAPGNGPVIVNRVDEHAPIGSHGDGPCVIEQPGSGARQGPNLFSRLFGKKDCVPGDSQVITYQPGTSGSSHIIQIAQIPTHGEPPLIDAAKSAGTDIIQVGNTPNTAGPQIIQAANPIDNGGPKVIQAANPLDTVGPQLIQAGDPGPTPLPGIPILPPAGPASPTLPPGTTTSGATPPLGGAPIVDPTQVPWVHPGEIICMRQPWRPGLRIMEWFQNRSASTGVISEPTYANGALVADPRFAPTFQRPWRPGDRMWEWFTGKPVTTVTMAEPAKSAEAKKLETKPAETKSEDAKKIQRTEDYLALENKLLEKRLQEKIALTSNVPFSTAMPTIATPGTKNADPAPLAIPTPSASSTTRPKEEQPLALPAPPVVPAEVKVAAAPTEEKRDMWGNGSGNSVTLPGKSVLDGAVKSADVMEGPPPGLVRHNDPLMMPERLNPGEDRTKPRMMVMAPRDEANLPPLGGPMPGNSWPLGAQSVLAARGGLQGPVTYVPMPVVTVPERNHPPTPPEPRGLEAPQLNAYVNGFSPPPQPKGTQQYPAQGMMPANAMNPYANPMLAQQMMQHQAMQQQMMQQQAMQQQMMQQQAMISQAPAMNFARQYTGPQAPNPVGGNAGIPAGYRYPPMMQQQQQPIMPVSYQQPMPAQVPTAAMQVQQMIKVLRESPYPATREWAGQQLAGFDWRMHPQVVPMLIQSASQDPAASVRAGCVSCLGRAQAAVEPVFNLLHALRNDIDPRVRQEVEQAFIRLGQTSRP